MTVRLVDGLPVGLKGNPHHPLNRGGLCPVGQAGLDVRYSTARLRTPQRQGQGGLEPTTWETALEEIASRLRELRGANQGQRVALLTGTADQLFLELAQQIAHSMGSPHVARLDETVVTPYLLSQGTDEAPGFDLEHSDLVLALGFDLYEDGPAPLHAISAMVGTRPAERRTTLIHVGTRQSPTASKAEEHLVVRPGSYAALALGVAHVLVREGGYDRDFVAQHTFGFDDWTDERGERRLGFRRLLLERYYPERAAQLCGLDAASIVRVARRFANASSPIALIGGAATSATNTTWTVLAVQALNALIGAFDRPGGIFFPRAIPMQPLPPLPEAASDLGSSLFAASESNAALFGIDPVEALADAVLSDSNPIDILFVAECDPAHQSPAWPRLLEAFERVPLVVALTPFLDETARRADIVLPTHVPLEDWRVSTTPATVSFSVLGIARPVVESIDTRHAADLLLELAGRSAPESAEMAALPWKTYEGYLEDRLEGLAISGEGAIVTGSFEEDWKHFLEERGWRFLEHKRPQDFWRDLTHNAAWWNPVRAQTDLPRLFATPSGRYEFHSQTLERRLRELGSRVDGTSAEEDSLRVAARALGLQVESDEVCLPHYEPALEGGEGPLTLLPFRPITARGEFGSNSRMLMEMFGYTVFSGWQTWAEFSSETAHALDVEDGDLVALESDRGSIEAVVRVMPWGAAEAVHVPLGLGREVEGRRIGANPVDVVPLLRDPISGALALDSTRVNLRLVRRRQHGGPAPRHGGHAG
jgi:anaerobic selenocysteine-containing dehydrogenase